MSPAAIDNTTPGLAAAWYAVALAPDVGIEPLAVIERWSDRYRPPPGLEDERLAALPYLDDGFGFQPIGAADEWVGRVFAFNFSSAVSHGPHSTSISGHKHAVPRLVRGVTRRLLLDAEATLVDDLEAYRSGDLPVADDFER